MRYINLHTHKSSENPHVIEVLNVYPNELLETNSFFSSGIHPWHLDENRIDADLDMMERRLCMNRNIAIGECGLDKKIEVPFDLQASVFERHLRLAQKYKRPVIVHCVAAYSEVIAMKKKVNFNLPMVIHGF
ncbi:MAG TPA: TatD family hydrolase, partial [Flavobacterium sp.]